MPTTKMPQRRFTLNLIRMCGALCLCLSLCAITSHAQDAKSPKRGFNPGGSYAISDIESISTSGGNLSLSVPLGGLPAGRGGLKASVNLVYNSKLWDTYEETAYSPFGYAYDETRMKLSPDGGWRYAFKYDLTVDFKYLNGGLGYCDSAQGDGGLQLLKLLMTLPDGSRHALHLDGRSGEGDYADVWPDGIPYCGKTPPESGTLTYFSHDGSFLRLDVEHDSDQNWQNNPWTLYLPDGSRVTGGNAAQRIYDRNNNYIEVVNGMYNGHAAAYLNDQVGRSVIVEYESAPNQDSVHVRGTNNELLTWNVLYTTILINKTYQTLTSPYNRQLNQFVKVVSQITLPAQAGGLSYSFGYNANTAAPSYGWGEVNSVTLPSGARASYVYRDDGVNTIESVNAAANNPTSKSLVSRPEDDLTPGALPSNSPCNPGAETCVTETWTYAFAFDVFWGVLNTTVTGPDGGVMRDYFNQETQDTKNYKSERADGTVVERRWQNNTPRTVAPIYLQSPSANRINPFVRLEFTSLKDAGGNLSKTAIKEFSQDKNGNTTGVKEYDWVAYGSVHRDASGKPDAVPAGATLKRVTTNSYYNPTPDASDSTTADPDGYHLANTPRLHGLAQSSEVRDGAGTTYSRAEFFYDNTGAVGYVATPIGNLTGQKSWDSQKGAYSNPLTAANSVSALTQYNVYGSPTLTTDARGTQTQLTYGAVNGYADLYPTITRAAFGTSLEQVTTLQYDYWMGAVTRSVDPNGVATATAYDAFGRPTLVKAAEGIAAQETRTATEYSDANRRVIVRSDLNNIGDAKLVSVQHYDQLGRVRLSRTLENSAVESATDETAGVKVQTRYRSSGSNSYAVVSNPYRAPSSAQATGEPSMGWTRSKSDNGGRAVETQTFNGAALPAPWGTNTSSSGVVTTAYDAEFTTVTDQKGRVRRSMMNGLGQLARVDEPDKDTGSLGATTSPVQPTVYAYDALGNLTQVAQVAQTRAFNYSSLARLTSATNPESGAVSYAYDAGGNLLTKTDARGITSTYAYDALSRNTTVNYSDTAITPDIERYYDNPAAGANGRGRFWHDYKGGNYTAGSDVEHRAVDAYDALGRPLAQRQKFKTGGVWSADYATSRAYNRSGSIGSQTYPSGHTVSYNYDAAGRLGDSGGNPAFTGNLGDGATRTYATGIVYDEASRMTREQFGTQTPLYHKQHYNTRGQMYDVRLGSATDEWSWNRGAIIAYYDGAYSWSNGGLAATGADNNGNATRAQSWVPGDDAVTTYALSDELFDYDALNRLKSVNEYKEGTNVARVQAFAQSYTYDVWGNRTINQAGTTQTLAPEMRKAFTVDTQTNRLGVPAGQAGVMSYDNAGNLTTDSYTGAGARAYDAENRMTSAVIGINSSSVYTYDADGRRVRRQTPAETVWQVYGMDGELLVEYAANAPASSPQKEYGYRNGELLVTASTTLVDNAAADASATQNPAGAWSYGARAGGGAFTLYATHNNQFGAAIDVWTPGGTCCPMVARNNSGVTQTYVSAPTVVQPADMLNLHPGPAGERSVVRWTAPAAGTVEVAGRFQGLDTGGTTTDVQVAHNATVVASGNVNGYGSQMPFAVTRTVAAGDTLEFSVGVGTNGTYYSDSTGLAVTVTLQATRPNLALASSGATVSASSTLSPYVPAYLIDGDRKGVNYGVWLDSTSGAFPDWVEVDFGAAKSVGEVDVYTRQDDVNNLVEPTQATTFSLYGTTGYEVQYWTGAAWATVPGGSVTNNNLVWRKFTFPAVTTSKVRVVVNGVADNIFSRLVEVEAYGSGAAGGQAEVNWLVTDHLGTPRMVVDATGTLAGIKRHDYLPFGEEVAAGVGGRTQQQGYSGDNVRQQFAGSERDDETGLDFMQARYYSSSQGRFTSVDPIYTTLERLIDPQRLNLYAYTRNNPVRFIDPDGMDLLLNAKTEEEAKKKFALFQKGLTINDRKHTQLVVGDGKNGFAKGQFGLTVDANHKSKSENFQAIQKIANDKDETAVVSIVSPKDTFSSNVGVQQGTTVVIQSFKTVFGVDNYVSKADAVLGQTLFPLRGSPLADTIYSTSTNTEVYVANDMSDVEIVATAFHELRAHVFLSNVGRDIPKGSHGSPGVDQAAKAAEAEARGNFAQKAAPPPRRRR